MQLKVEDLRVGNAFLQKGGQFVEFASVEDLERIQRGAIIAVGLRLTEGWMKRLGLKGGHRGYYYIDDIVISAEGQVYFGEDEVWLCECHFVHEFQNLFKSIKKKELPCS